MMTEQQARELIEAVRQQTEALRQLNEAVSTLASGLDGNMERLLTTVDEIEQSVGAIVTSLGTEGGDGL